MYQNTETYADKILSGFGLRMFVQRTKTLFESAPFFISDHISYDEIIEDYDDTYSAASADIERKENEIVRTAHSKVEANNIDLTEKSLKEPIDHLTTLNLKDNNYNLMEFSASKIIDVFVRNLYSQLNSVYGSATYFPAAQTYDVNSESTEWGTSATATPQADVQSALDLFFTSVDKDVDLNNVVMFASHDLISVIYKTTDFRNWNNSTFRSDYTRIPAETVLSAYFGHRVVILPQNLFSSKFIIQYVDKPEGTPTIGNNLLNSSSIITGFYNLNNIDPILNEMSVQVSMNNVEMDLPGNIIMMKQYPSVERRGTTIDGMTINSVYVHNQKALARLSNIYS